MMSNSIQKVFIDSNMLIFAVDFQKNNILEWMNLLYDDIYIHIEVYNELLTSSIKKLSVLLLMKNNGLYLIHLIPPI